MKCILFHLENGMFCLFVWEFVGSFVKCPWLMVIRGGMYGVSNWLSKVTINLIAKHCN